jgi:LmbE family N-acetylglucosaminyl deacetylase
MKQLFLLIALAIATSVSSQAPQKLNSADIYQAIKKANVLASVLYVAAHPDDENTTLISYLSNEKHARTAYLSLTRGDGGQNLIGPEIRELLGVIRTQELLAARRTDGGEQRFTRANDFGYSKHPDETLEIWNKDEVLADVVKMIREFKPDVIINRFDHRSPGTTHGHHTSSAMLSVEAFDLAGKTSAYSNQLKTLEPWQAKRQFFNTSWWFYGSQEKFDNADKSKLLEFETGVYYPSKGLSNSEISALSRSQHKSQGFGRTGSRGSDVNYLELINGDIPKDKSDLFEGINTTWSRLKNGETVGKLLKTVEADYNFKDPSASLPMLMQAYTALQQLEDSHWKTTKSKELELIISACAGLYLEAAAETPTATKGSTVTLNVEAINRSNIAISVDNIVFPASNQVIEDTLELTPHKDIEKQFEYTIASTARYTSPYWLTKKGTLGMYAVENETFIGKPQTPSPHKAQFKLTIAGMPITIIRPIVYKASDPVKGEVYMPFEIVPKASVSLNDDVVIFENEASKTIAVNVTAHTASLVGSLKLDMPKSWEVSPKEATVSIKQIGATQTINFKVTPPKQQNEGFINPVLTTATNTYNKTLEVIEYDHIPTQRVLLPSESKVVRLDIKKKGNSVGYIVGAGDVVPESLRQIGYKVTLLNVDNITAENLKSYDAIVVGIRAYNTVNALKFKQTVLLDYVNNGGNLIVQYNTSHRLLVQDNLAPYKLNLSRDRVTDEFAKVTFLNPEHPVLNTPNKITQTDFEGWVQERGLYFPDDWGAEFTPLFAMNDDGEPPKKGSLLIAKYGKGHYIYTGLSFFREFPAGVSGAYRLFTNLISLGK